MPTTEARTIVKKVDHAALYSDGTILIQGVRASYPHVFAPYKGDNDTTGNGKYGIVALMPKGAEYRAAKDLIRDRINELMRENKVEALKADNKFLRDGDQAAKAEYAGMFTINASEVRRPAVRGNKRDPKTGKPVVLVPGKDDDVIYAGAWVNVLIRPWFQNNQYGKKVNAGLAAVQFVRDDEAFGQGRISDDAIDSTFDDGLSDDDSGFDDSLGDELDI